MKYIIYLTMLFSFFSVEKGFSEKNKVAVIVDGYGVGNYYPTSFKSKGIECVHIQTTEEILPIFKKAFYEELYLKTLIYKDDLNKILKELAEYDVRCVIAGLDPGVELADKITNALNLQGNPIESSITRRNKYEMAKKLESANLPTPKFLKFKSWEELISWQSKNNVNYPIVLKPMDSGGTDGVFICKNINELETAFSKLIGKTNVLGKCNTEILAQSFLKGTEYIVNSVSMNGKLYIVSILEGQKTFVDGYSFIYDKEIMLPFEGDIQNSLIDMHQKVTAALDIKNGPAHGEYMYTEDGPILIEIGARVSGGTNVKAYNQSLELNQIDLTVDAYIDQNSFLQTSLKPYKIKKNFCQMFISTSHSGVITNSSSFIEFIKQLESYSDMRLKISDGERVDPTIDLISSLGCVFLVHEDQDVIQSDYKKINEFAKSIIKAQ